MTQHVRYDLVTGAWAEVRWKKRRSDLPNGLGLRDLLVHAHEIEALAITPPPALSAMYRLLYALMARVTGLDVSPKGLDDWLDRREGIFGEPLDPDHVDAYFDQYPGRFDLFHPERPFLQDPRLKDPQVCPKSAGVNKLTLGRPAGNNSVWFGHHWDATPSPVPAADAFSALLVWLYYGPSGRCATRTHADITAADVSAGPLRTSLSYHPEGSSLLETLQAGLPAPPDGLRREDDPCPWELPGLPDPLAPPRTPDPHPGPCSRLTGGWQHALLLVPDDTGMHVTDAYITWGRREKQPPVDDSYVIKQVSKQGNVYARPADSSRALWRDLDGLLDLPNATTAQPRRPTVFDTVDDLGSFKVRALGFEQDGKTKDIQFVSATTPPLLFRINEQDSATARRIGDLRTAGELYGRRLDYAVKRAWASITDGKLKDCTWQEHAAAMYWPKAEEIFWTRMRRQEFDRPWRVFLNAATSAFEQVTHDHIRGTREARAIEKARLELYGGVPKRTRATRRSTPPSASPTVQQVTMTSQQTAAPATYLERPRQFVADVFRLCEDPGNRSALRSGLGKPLSECHRMHKVIAARVPEEWDNGQRAYYAIAAMIASLPPQARGERGTNAAGDRNLGQCLAEAVARGSVRESTAESRLDLLTRQSVDGLHRHLPAVVRALADRPAAVDWARLLWDLRRWDNDHDQIARRWLQSFYRTRFKADLQTAQAADDDQHDAQ